MLYSNEDFENFYVRYKAEALPKNITVKAFCIHNNVPWNLLTSGTAILFERRFSPGYRFMKVEKEGGETFFSIDWKDVVLLLANAVINKLKIR